MSEPADEWEDAPTQESPRARVLFDQPTGVGSAGSGLRPLGAWHPSAPIGPDERFPDEASGARRRAPTDAPEPLVRPSPELRFEDAPTSVSEHSPLRRKQPAPPALPVPLVHVRQTGDQWLHELDPAARAFLEAVQAGVVEPDGARVARTSPSADRSQVTRTSRSVDRSHVTRTSRSVDRSRVARTSPSADRSQVTRTAPERPGPS
jgi:hypothetical protein